MNLIFVIEGRFVKDKRGDIYGDATNNKNLWNRYLAVFSHIYIMARVKSDKNYIGKPSNLSSSKNITFLELPYFIGPLQYLRVKQKITNKIEEYINSIDANYICRVPGNIGNLVIKKLYNKKIPFGVEVVGDPWDVFAPGTIKHPLRFFFRRKGYLDLKSNVKKASGVLYVTKNALQKRYPKDKKYFQTSVSDVNIKDDLIATNSKIHIHKEKYKLISIGSLEQMYKSPDIVIKAIKKINENGIDCKLIWLGDGVFRLQMEALCKELGILNKVEFKGNVSADEVRKYLKESDIFVLASRTEGLPRAIIEAMSIGLPCIGTNVGGIPELLSKEVIIPKNNELALVKMIEKLVNEPNFYNNQAKGNLKNAHIYKESILQKKRNQFYQFLLNLHK